MKNACCTSSLPGTSPLTKRPIDIRPFFPVEPCTTPSSFPPLPSPPRQDFIHGAYVLSTHIVPAAFPRVVPDVPLPIVPPYSASASERQKQATVLVHELIDRQMRFTQGQLGGEPSRKPLWNCINRYVRKENHTASADGITLFVAHANGFPKEIWEPVLRNLFDSSAAFLIGEVWSWEAVQHGDSALLNAEHLSGIYEWLDNTRDIANFLLHYLPDEVTPAPLPTQLTRVPKATSNSRIEFGFAKRRVVVVGHSFGGTTSVLAAFNFPKLFSSLILVDPVITPLDEYVPGSVFNMTLSAFTRRDHWPSREEAWRLLKQSPFFLAWHPTVLRIYVDRGLHDDPNGGVELKTTPVQEGLVFLNFRASQEAWAALENLDESITLRWIVPATGLQSAGERVWLRPANSSNVIFSFAGHLIVQEAPVELAQDIAGFLLEKYKPRSRAFL